MKQYVSRARVFVDRYIRDEYAGLDGLDTYISKYEREARPVVARAICSRLIEKVSPKNHRRLLEWLESLRGYIASDNIRKMQEGIKGVCEEYECKKEESHTELEIKLENSLKDSLKRQGISGSAIGVNVEASSQWNDVLGSLDSMYNKLLDEAAMRQASSRVHKLKCCNLRIYE